MTQAEINHLELLRDEMNRRANQTDIRHETELMRINESAEYNLFAMLKPKLVKDGNQWCCLYGEDLQIGIAGFGDSPYKAIIEWNKEWYKSTTP